MSDTTGWEEHWWGFSKVINKIEFRCDLSAQHEECLFTLTFNGNAVTNPMPLRECQILAHDTARLWAGDEE